MLGFLIQCLPAHRNHHSTNTTTTITSSNVHLLCPSSYLVPAFHYPLMVTNLYWCLQYCRYHVILLTCNNILLLILLLPPLLARLLSSLLLNLPPTIDYWSWNCTGIIYTKPALHQHFPTITNYTETAPRFIVITFHETLPSTACRHLVGELLLLLLLLLKWLIAHSLPPILLLRYTCSDGIFWCYMWQM